jgi:hypothetical protein
MVNTIIASGAYISFIKLQVLDFLQKRIYSAPILKKLLGSDFA